MKWEKGMRIGAYQCGTGENVLVGYGSYQGEDEIAIEGRFTNKVLDIIYKAVLKVIGKKPYRDLWNTPVLRMDEPVEGTSRIMFGFQCWWGPEDEIKRLVEKGVVEERGVG